MWLFEAYRQLFDFFHNSLVSQVILSRYHQLTFRRSICRSLTESFKRDSTYTWCLISLFWLNSHTSTIGVLVLSESSR